MRANTQPRFHRLSKVAMLEEYYEWLCDLVDVKQPGCGYTLLLRTLHDREFYWSVPNDDNRAFEGKNLRERFCEENGIEYVFEYFDDSCSMLELIIGLAHRCEDIMADQKNSLTMKEWFWRLLSNAGLDSFTDNSYYEMNCRLGSVDKILNRIVDRSYQRNGKGGLFPLKGQKKDQRKVELWYQMCAYLLENYYMRDENL
jgi:hypothetical protein